MTSQQGRKTRKCRSALMQCLCRVRVVLCGQTFPSCGTSNLTPFFVLGKVYLFLSFGTEVNDVLHQTGVVKFLQNQADEHHKRIYALQSRLEDRVGQMQNQLQDTLDRLASTEEILLDRVEELEKRLSADVQAMEASSKAHVWSWVVVYIVLSVVILVVARIGWQTFSQLQKQHGP